VASHVRRLLKRGLWALVVVAVAEGLLRGGFMLWAHAGPPPHCGLRPELLARLLHVYGGPRPLRREDDSSHAQRSATRVDPHRGYRLAPGLRNDDVQGTVTSTNSRGMRGTREFAVPKPASVVRIVALGDSFTFGVGVPDDATWPAQLEAALPGVEVANLGQPAFAHDQMYFALEDDGLPLQPDAVILGFYEHDLERNELTFYCAEKPRFSPSPAGWIVENQPVPDAADVYDRVRRIPLVYAVPRLLLEMVTQPATDDGSRAERANEILRRTRAIAESAGARFILVNLPNHPESPANREGFFAQYCDRTGAECVDPWPQFRIAAGTNDETALLARYSCAPNDIHYSRAGYAVVADTLRAYLAEHPITARSH
jgi:lysophospholipase L1-like esterase